MALNKDTTPNNELLTSLLYRNMSLPNYSEEDPTPEQLPSYFDEANNSASSTSTDLGIGVQDVVAHLKFLQVLDTLKKTIVEGIPDDQVKKYWQCYVTRATRRFIIFVSALKEKFTESTHGFQDYMANIYPPIDVLMVWHTFLLSPKTIFREFKAAKLLSFTKYPFPMVKVASVIGEKLMYKPDPTLMGPYSDLVNGHMSAIGLQEHYELDSYAPFSPEEIEWTLYCPSCFARLGIAPLYKPDLQTGFSYFNFELAKDSEACTCTNSPIVSHGSLNFCQILYDTSKEGRFLSVTERSIQAMVAPDLTLFGQNQKDIFGKELKKIQKSREFNQTIAQVVGRFTGRSMYIAREYLAYNLVHTTLPQRGTIPIHEDLVAACLRQEEFNKKMIELDWVNSSFRNLTIEEAINRYRNFAKLLKKSATMLVPTLDIDLLWHTHQLYQYRYFAYCKKVIGEVVDHNDKFEETKLNDSFEKTCRLYKSKFGEDYTICHCFYCSANRRSSRSIFRKSSQTKEEQVKSSEYGLSHISDHNAIAVDTTKSKAHHTRVTQKYKVDSVEEFPWFKREADPYLYVVPFISLGRADIHDTGVYACSLGNEADPMGACGGISSYMSGPVFILRENPYGSVSAPIHRRNGGQETDSGFS